MVISTAQLRSTKLELRFYAGSNLAHGVSEIRDGEDLWPWFRLEIRLKCLSSVNRTTKTIHHHQFISESLQLSSKNYFFLKLMQYFWERYFKNKFILLLLFLFLVWCHELFILYRWIGKYRCFLCGSQQKQRNNLPIQALQNDRNTSITPNSQSVQIRKHFMRTCFFKQIISLNTVVATKGHTYLNKPAP